jgi:hypothetical protein
MFTAIMFTAMMSVGCHKCESSVHGRGNQSEAQEMVPIHYSLALVHIL